MEDTKIQVDMLVNCAGFGDLSLFKDSDVEKMADVIRINDLHSVLTRLFLPGLVAMCRGPYSMWLLWPFMAVYYTSKAYVLSFTEALSVDLKGTGVKSALCPRPVNTGFARTARAEDANVSKRSASADADEVVRYGIGKAGKGKVIAVYSILFKISMWFERLLPRSVVRNIVYGIQKKTGKSM